MDLIGLPLVQRGEKALAHAMKIEEFMKKMCSQIWHEGAP
jgi:hypothetical protein